MKATVAFAGVGDGRLRTRCMQSMHGNLLQATRTTNMLVRMQTAAEWHVCAKLLELCRTELADVVVGMVWRKEFCTATAHVYYPPKPSSM